MSDDEQESIVIPNGFSKIIATQYPTVNDNTRIRIKRQKQMHKFRSGYENVGRPLTLFSGNERDAREVYQALKELFDDD